MFSRFKFQEFKKQKLFHILTSNKIIHSFLIFHCSHHRVRFKKGILNGQQQAVDLTDDFDGLVGQDGVLTFLNQGTAEGTSSSLSLMADLSAGNITFSELMAEQHSTATPLLLQRDPADPS